MRCPSLSELPPPLPGRTGWPWTEETPTLPLARLNGAPWPRVSIVTPAYNQADYLEETIRSVLLQGYPDLEYIIINDGSTDATVDVIRKYEPWLSYWTTQPNQGQCAAINNGFRLVTGTIQAYLNSDDLLLPGALDRVAQEFDPLRGRQVVMGRCHFTDEHGQFTGIEHPSHFESHRRVLEVWKGHTIPQPSVFWTPEVWRNCGPIIEDLGPAWIDYGLFCRFSKRYTFHRIDQVLSTYRLHTQSKTQRSTEKDRLEESIQISKRYWGARSSLMYCQLAWSLARHRFNRVGRGSAWLKRAKEARRNHQAVQMLGYGLIGGVLAPETAFYAAIYPALRNRSRGIIRRVLDRLVDRRSVSPQTEIFLERTELWEDGWAGPRVVIKCASDRATRKLLLRGLIDLSYLSKPQTLTIWIDGQPIGKQRLNKSGDFALELPLAPVVSAGEHSIEVQASTFFVPHSFIRVGDHRPLSWKARAIEFSD
jgi:glycosyltransferase involved in cell wall biosynthesis